MVREALIINPFSNRLLQKPSVSGAGERCRGAEGLAEASDGRIKPHDLHHHGQARYCNGASLSQDFNMPSVPHTLHHLFSIGDMPHL